MYSASRFAAVILLFGSAALAGAQVLRVCADPNNLPYSNQRRQGFENKLAAMVAQDLGRRLEYVWLPPSPRQSEKIQKSACDLMMEVPSRYPLFQTTQPYYTSSYVFVTKRDRHLRLRSLDDPFLRAARIGLHGVGDGSAIPPAHELASRGIVRNVAVYSIFGNLAEENPAAKLIAAVAHGDIDVAIAWGPLAGYFARNSSIPLEVSPICPGKEMVMPSTFSMSVGVRQGDETLYQQIEAELTRRQSEIKRVLQDYGVPLIDSAAELRSCQ